MKTTNKNQKVTLVDYYAALPSLTAPKTTFIEAITSRLGVKRQTVQHWVLRGITPASKEHCDIIAEIVGRPATELFADYAEKFQN